MTERADSEEIQRLRARVREVEARLEIQERAASGQAHDLKTALARAQRAVAATVVKSAFLANMSHEIRTPLNGMLGTAELLLGTPLDARQRDYVETLRSSTESLLGVLSDILDLSKLEAGRLQLAPTPFDLLETVREVISILGPRAADKGLALQVTYPSDVPRHFVGDRGRIRQILVNLVSNAIKFTERGSVRIVVDGRANAEEGAWLELCVADTGIGMGAEALERIFEKFGQADPSATRRHGGAGLGLTICRHLVDLMAGRIEVESHEGKGASFRVGLPLRAGAGHALDGVSVEPPPPDSFPGARVLVVEDNLVNRKVALAMLERLACRVDHACDGAEALERVSAGDHDLVFMDCQMPRMDGYAATEAIRALPDRVRASLPVVALTANAMEGDRERCLEAGMNDYLAKPVRFDALREMLARWLPRGT